MEESFQNIKKLPDSVISRISAGEVITSPYNIIKELLENSIDADSTKIKIKIDSTLSLIIIKDDGIGINEKDMEFLCKNHFTSKIKDLGDLKNNLTYGFRGEALYSISLCSCIKIKTKTKSNDNIGWLGIYKNSELVEKKQIAIEESGTTIEITDIFHNNKIRRDHFYKNRNEYMKCIELIKSYGILYDGIELEDESIRGINKYDDDNQKKMDYILKNFANTPLKHFKDPSGNFNVIYTDLNYNHKYFQFILFINGRLVKNDNFKNRIIKKYRSVKKGLNPFVFIEINVEYADVNVHPSKAEVIIDESIFDGVMKIFDDQMKNFNQKVILEDIHDKALVELQENSTQYENRSVASNIKLYSSPFTRKLDESSPLKQDCDHSPLKRHNNDNYLVKRYNNDHSIAIKNHQSSVQSHNQSPKFNPIDPSFLKTLIFIGSANNFLFLQHQSNLIKINKELFLYNAFYQKIWKDLGNFEISDEFESFTVDISLERMDFYREFLGFYFENNSNKMNPKINEKSILTRNLIGLPRIYDILPKNEIVKSCINEHASLDEIITNMARMLSKDECDVRLFNKIKVEMIGTEEVISNMRLLVDLKDLYKTFDRC